MEENFEESTDKLGGQKTYLHIDSIPDLILIEIFSRLNFSDLCVCSRVCQKWHILVKDFSLRKRIMINKSLQTNQFSSLIHYHFTDFLEEFKLLKTCSEDSLLSVKKNMLWKLTKQSNNLKKLVLMSCSLSTVSLKDLPSSLEHLSIRGSEIYPNVFFGLNPSLHVPHLVCLDVGGVSNFLTSQDLHVFSKLKSLRALYLEGCFRVNNGGIESIIDILPQLEVLDVEGTDISNDGLTTILEFCCNIRDLYIGHTSVDDSPLVSAKVETVRHLKTFCVRNTHVRSVILHSFLLELLSTHKLIVKNCFVNFKCSGSCNCFNTEETPVCFELSSAFPFHPGLKCQHYLTHKTYGFK